jgi:hypothetical protein
MKNLKILKVWQLIKKLATHVYRLTMAMHLGVQRVFAAQMARAALNVWVEQVEEGAHGFSGRLKSIQTHPRS